MDPMDVDRVAALPHDRARAAHRDLVEWPRAKTHELLFEWLSGPAGLAVLRQLAGRGAAASWARVADAAAAGVAAPSALAPRAVHRRPARAEEEPDARDVSMGDGERWAPREDEPKEAEPKVEAKVEVVAEVAVEPGCEGEMDEAVRAPREPGAVDEFYYPLGKGVRDREARELAEIRAWFEALRGRAGRVYAEKAEFEELFVKVVGLPRFVAVLLFDLLAVRGEGPGGGDGAAQNGTANGVAEDEQRAPSVSSASTLAESADPSVGENGDAGAAAAAAAVTAAAQAAPPPGLVGDGVRSDVMYVGEESMAAYYLKHCKAHSLDARLMRLMLPPGEDRAYLVPTDLKPLVRALLTSHQGLAFLHSTPEFQLRYAETVVERIFYHCTRHRKGKLTLSDIKRHGLLGTLFFIDDEEDINRERRYFSYEHFYVLYCRFWELDTDHDLRIDREDLMRYGGHALTYRIVDRVFIGYPRATSQENVTANTSFMTYADFIWFCLSEEDKHTETALDYWYHCVDLDGDGYISLYDMEYFYKEQLHRMECLGHEPVQVRDILCQLLDMVKPNCTPMRVSRSDLKNSRLAGSFFNILFNLTKFFALETRDPLQVRQEHATPELTDWDRFAALEYLRLSAEEEAEEEDGWEDVREVPGAVLPGEAPF